MIDQYSETVTYVPLQSREAAESVRAIRNDYDSRISESIRAHRISRQDWLGFGRKSCYPCQGVCESRFEPPALSQSYWKADLEVHEKPATTWNRSSGTLLPSLVTQVLASRSQLGIVISLHSNWYLASLNTALASTNSGAPTVDCAA